MDLNNLMIALFPSFSSTHRAAVKGSLRFYSVMMPMLFGEKATLFLSKRFVVGLSGCHFEK